MARGRVVELTCHPGLLDATLEGRDGSLADGQLHRRAREHRLLGRPEFAQAVRAAGFEFREASTLASREPAAARLAG